MSSSTKQLKLMDALVGVLREQTTMTPGESILVAGVLTDRVIELGWQWHPAPEVKFNRPITEEDWEMTPKKVAPTPEQEIEFIDRIIAGQPTLPLMSPIEEGFMQEVGDAIQKMYQESGKISVPVAPTKMVIHWQRIPRFDNYEVNMYGEIRNRFTRRVLELEKTRTGKYVDMHDKDGFPHYVSVDYIVKEVFN